MSGREYADQRAHDVAWMTAAERAALDAPLVPIADGRCPRCDEFTSDERVCTACGYVSGSSSGENDAPPDAGPSAVCWEHQAGELPIRLSFSIKVF